MLNHRLTSEGSSVVPSNDGTPCNLMLSTRTVPPNPAIARGTLVSGLRTLVLVSLVFVALTLFTVCAKFLVTASMNGRLASFTTPVKVSAWISCRLISAKSPTTVGTSARSACRRRGLSPPIPRGKTGSAILQKLSLVLTRFCF